MCLPVTDFRGTVRHTCSYSTASFSSASNRRRHEATHHARQEEAGATSSRQHPETEQPMERDPVMPSLSNTSLDLLSQLGADDGDFSGCVSSGFLARGMTVSPPPSKVSRTAGDLERPSPQPTTQSRPDVGASPTPLPAAQQPGCQENASADDQAQSAPV